MTTDNPIDTSALIKAEGRGRRVVALGPLAAAARYDTGGRIEREIVARMIGVSSIQDEETLLKVIRREI